VWPIVQLISETTFEQIGAKFPKSNSSNEGKYFRFGYFKKIYFLKL
jgi:hypothetical protein